MTNKELCTVVYRERKSSEAMLCLTLCFLNVLLALPSAVRRELNTSSSVCVWKHFHCLCCSYADRRVRFMLKNSVFDLFL